MSRTASNLSAGPSLSRSTTNLAPAAAEAPAGSPGGSVSGSGIRAPPPMPVAPGAGPSVQAVPGGSRAAEPSGIPVFRREDWESQYHEERAPPAARPPPRQLPAAGRGLGAAPAMPAVTRAPPHAARAPAAPAAAVAAAATGQEQLWSSRAAFGAVNGDMDARARLAKVGLELGAGSRATQVHPVGGL